MKWETRRFAHQSRRRMAGRSSRSRRVRRVDYRMMRRRKLSGASEDQEEVRTDAKVPAERPQLPAPSVWKADSDELEKEIKNGDGHEKVLPSGFYTPPVQK